MSEALMGRKAAGYRQGYAKGVQRGLRQGMQKGIKEGLSKGEIDGMRRVIQRQIRQRFGSVPASMQRRVETIGNVRTLERIADAVLKVDDLDQLSSVARGKSALKPKRGRFSARREGPAATGSKRRPRRMSPVRYPH